MLYKLYGLITFNFVLLGQQTTELWNTPQRYLFADQAVYYYVNLYKIMDPKLT
jgi:hypothetical protein